MNLELTRRIAESPSYAKVFFVLHVLLQISFVFVLLYAAYCFRAGDTGPVIYVILFAGPVWLHYRMFRRWCVQYRSKREPQIHYGLQSADRGQARFEVLEDGSMVPSNEPLIADTIPLEPDEPFVKWDYDWLGHWISRRAPNSILRRIPKTGTLSTSIYSVMAPTAALFAFGLAWAAMDRVPGFLLYNPVTLFGVCVIAYAFRRFIRFVTRTPSPAKSFDRRQPLHGSRAGKLQSIAIYAWRLFSCEPVGKFPVNRRRQRRTFV